jgi:hypothetical protein
MTLQPQSHMHTGRWTQYWIGCQFGVMPHTGTFHQSYPSVLEAIHSRIKLILDRGKLSRFFA